MLSLLILSLFSIAEANEAGPIKAVKMLDGKAVYCQVESDLGKRGYRPAAARVNATDSGIDLSFQVASLRCEGSKETGFQWLPHPLNAPITYLSWEKDPQPVTVYITKSEAYVVNDTLYRNRNMIQPRELENLPSQPVAYSLPLNAFLSGEELGALDEGKTVDVRLEYFNLFYKEYEYKGKRENLGARAGGAFALLFQLSRDPETGLLRSSSVTIR